MKAITLQEVPALKAADIRRYEENRYYVGNAATDQRIDYILKQSDEDYMNLHNEVVKRENNKAAQAAEKQANLIAERKATGKSKKTYRAEYDALMADYKATKNMESYKKARSIAKFAF
ncbi:MAG: hypothetical protein LBN27_02105 [Prevotellaceae bacterium]|jgi:ribosomal protein L3|nr:hypothetical protein [Prevotellaceae bacterium]